MKYAVVKTLRLQVEVKADSAQEAWEKQLEMDDTKFEVLDCDYEVYDARWYDVSGEVEFS